MKSIDKKLLQKFLKIAGDRLSGEWVILGGTVLPLLDIPSHPTVDIDIVSKDREPSNSQRLCLMGIAEEVGLPVEAINSAAEFFLRRVPDWKSQLHEYARGKKAVFFLPSPSLFVFLKVGRLTETDLTDCIAMLRYARKKKIGIESSLKSQIQKQLERATNEREGRLRRLLEELKKTSRSKSA